MCAPSKPSTGDRSIALVSHTLQPSTSSPMLDRMIGSLVISVTMGCLVLGPFVPLAVLIMAGVGYTSLAATLAAIVLATMCLAVESPVVCRIFMKAAGYFTKGVHVHFEQQSIQALSQTRGSMWCIHPHGTGIGFGFCLNGAVRFRAQDEATFLPPEITKVMGTERMRRADGVQAPVLFKVPFLRNLLLGLGCCTPASKAGMTRLFQRRADFGILPGGMEEVALYTHGRERIYLSKRKGFLKYALQYGYLVQPAYTFGECDLYHSMTAGANWRLWMLRRFGFVIPVFWGPTWYAPWLPKSDVALHTVVGAPLQLPLLENPSVEEVAKYHTLYVEKVTELFDTYKGRFGYSDRQLEIL